MGPLSKIRCAAALESLALSHQYFVAAVAPSQSPVVVRNPSKRHSTPDLTLGIRGDTSSGYIGGRVAPQPLRTWIDGLKSVGVCQ